MPCISFSALVSCPYIYSHLHIFSPCFVSFRDSCRSRSFRRAADVCRRSPTSKICFSAISHGCMGLFDNANALLQAFDSFLLVLCHVLPLKLLHSSKRGQFAGPAYLESALGAPPKPNPEGPVSVLQCSAHFSVSKSTLNFVVAYLILPTFCLVGILTVVFCSLLSLRTGKLLGGCGSTSATHWLHICAHLIADYFFAVRICFAGSEGNTIQLRFDAVLLRGCR